MDNRIEGKRGVKDDSHVSGLKSKLFQIAVSFAEKGNIDKEEEKLMCSLLIMLVFKYFQEVQTGLLVGTIVSFMDLDLMQEILP